MAFVKRGDTLTKEKRRDDPGFAASPLNAVLGVINAVGLHATSALLWGAPAKSDEAAGH